MISTRKFMASCTTAAQGKFIQRWVAQLAGRANLPGSDGKHFPKYLAETRPDFPITLNCDFIKSKEITSTFSKSFFGSLKHNIHKFGAILLENLPLENADDFSKFMHDTGLNSLSYVGGSGARDIVARAVLTASSEPPTFSIEPHNEMAYLPYWPHLFVAFCEKPASEGGETGLTDVRDVVRDLDPNVVDKFRQLGVCYYRNMPDAKTSDYLSWQESMSCNDKSEVEKMLIEIGQSFKWNDDGSLCFWKTQPAFAPHFNTGEFLWFNVCHSHNRSYFKAHPDFDGNLPDDRYPIHTYYGDGSDIEPEVLQHVRDVTWRNTVGMRLKKSDVLILDNMLIQHSRLSFKGDRRLLINMINLD